MGQRFYFDLTDGKSTIRDTKGAQAADLDEAIRDAQSVLDDEREASEGEWTLIIRDAAGEALVTLPVREAALK